jgi:hypothetical protein
VQSKKVAQYEHAGLRLWRLRMVIVISGLGGTDTGTSAIAKDGAALF